MPHHAITPDLMLFKRKCRQINLYLYYKTAAPNLVTENIDIAILNHKPLDENQKYLKILSNKGRLYCTAKYAEKYWIPQTLDKLQNHFLPTQNPI